MKIALTLVSQLHYDGHLVAIDSTNTNTYVGRVGEMHCAGLNSSFSGLTMADVRVIDHYELRRDVHRGESRLEFLAQHYARGNNLSKLFF